MPYIKLCSITHSRKQCFFSSLIASLFLSLPFHATFRLLPVTLSFKNDLIELKFVKKNMYLKTELDFKPGYPEKHSCGRIIFSNIFKLLNVFEYLKMRIRTRVLTQDRFAVTSKLTTTRNRFCRHTDLLRVCPPNTRHGAVVRAEMRIRETGTSRPNE